MHPLRLLTALLATSNEQQTATKVYEICVSPGCRADGAISTMKKLQALAPPGVIIKEGGCGSFCGKGPIVVSPGEKKSITHKYVTTDKAMDFLIKENPDWDFQTPFQSLIDGYDMYVLGEIAFSEKDYPTAVRGFQAAVDLGFNAAMDLQSTRRQMRAEEFTDEGIPLGLEWIVTARRHEAIGKLELDDVEGAILAAESSCNLARNKSAASFKVLAEAYRKKGADENELQILECMFALPVDESKLPREVANQRRELGFRLQSLRRQTRK